VKDNRATSNETAFSNNRAAIDEGPSRDVAVVSYLGIVLDQRLRVDDAVGANVRARSDHCAVHDDRPWPDSSESGNLSPRRDHCCKFKPKIA
jgi:hypothetical protein